MISGTIQREHEDAVGETSHSYANEGGSSLDKGAPVRPRDSLEGDGVDIRCGASREGRGISARRDEEIH